MQKATLFVLAAGLAVLFLTGCQGDAAGPSNADMIKNMKLEQNTDPNAPGAVQPRDMTGNPIQPPSGGGGGGKNKLSISK